jgi:hypothetical protein
VIARPRSSTIKADTCLTGRYDKQSHASAARGKHSWPPQQTLQRLIA